MGTLYSQLPDWIKFQAHEMFKEGPLLTNLIVLCDTSLLQMLGLGIIYRGSLELCFAVTAKP